jgi:hypothetical protein
VKTAVVFKGACQFNRNLYLMIKIMEIQRNARRNNSSGKMDSASHWPGHNAQLVRSDVLNLEKWLWAKMMRIKERPSKTLCSRSAGAGELSC